MKEIAPPPEIESTIAKRLRREGLLRQPRWPWALAAILVVALATALLRRDEPPKARYILLLYETASVNTGNRAEYSAWARNMGPLIVGGEELDQTTVMTLNATPSSPRLAGYFLIDAKDDATAERVTRACPHAKRGGGVTLRKIVL